MLISGKALGRRKPLFEDWSIPIPPEWSEGGGITLADVIERIVREVMQSLRG